MYNSNIFEFMILHHSNSTFLKEAFIDLKLLLGTVVKSEYSHKLRTYWNIRPSMPNIPYKLRTFKYKFANLLFPCRESKEGCFIFESRPLTDKITACTRAHLRSARNGLGFWLVASWNSRLISPLLPMDFCFCYFIKIGVYYILNL